MSKRNIKYTQEEVSDILKKYDLILFGEYINNGTPVKVKDLDGYMYDIRLSNILIGQNIQKFSPTNINTIYNIKLFLEKECNNSSILLSDIYVNNTGKLKLQCNSCGEIYYIDWAKLYSKDREKICQKCTKNKRVENSKLNQKDVEKFFEENGLFIDNDIYIKNSHLLKVIDKDGYKGKISYSNLQKGKIFNKFSESFNKENFVYNLNNFIKINNIDAKALEIISNDNHGHTIIRFQCECGEIFDTVSSRFVNGTKIKCDKCVNAISKIENLTIDFLRENNIDFIREKTFDDCKRNNKRPYFFDFYLLNYNTCIECDGRQHFEKVNFGGISDKQAFKNLKKVQKSDKEKDLYCKKNNIKIIRIPYWDFETEEYKNIILNNLIIH